MILIALAHIGADDWFEFFANVMRVTAVILLAVAGGMMARYYLTRPRMPKKAFIGYACYSLALMGTLIFKIQAAGVGTTPFRWWLTPFVVIGSVATIIGVLPALQWRHGQVEGDKADWVRRARLWRKRYNDHPGEGVFDDE